MATFNLKELGVIHMMIDNAIDSADEMDAPIQIVETLQSILDKIRPLIEAECEIFNEFQSIAESLDDLELSAKILVKDPTADIPEYH
jgi:hypothetical protein